MVRIGVILVAGVALLSGLAGLVIGGSAVAVGAALDIQAPVGQFSWEGASGVTLISIGLSIMIIGLAQIIIAVGLWRMRRWAWWLGVGVEVFTFLASVVGLFTGAFTLQSVVSLVISGVLLFYLLLPHVRQHFGSHPHTAREALPRGG